MGWYACAHNVSQPCGERAHDVVLEFSEKVRALLGGLARARGRLCTTHRRIAQCSSCGQISSGYNCAPSNVGLKAGLDFDTDLRPLSEQVANRLGRQCRGIPGSFDQFHPRLVAQVCDGCRKRSTTLHKEKPAHAAAAAARVAAEATRKMAAIAAQRPDRGIRVGVFVPGNEESAPLPPGRTRGTAAPAARSSSSRRSTRREVRLVLQLPRPASRRT